MFVVSELADVGRVEAKLWSKSSEKWEVSIIVQTKLSVVSNHVSAIKQISAARERTVDSLQDTGPLLDPASVWIKLNLFTISPLHPQLWHYTRDHQARIDSGYCWCPKFYRKKSFLYEGESRGNW